MVKYVAILLAVVGTFVAIDTAEARGRRGGCPGGVCYNGGYTAGVAVAPAKTAAVAAEPQVVAEAAPAAAPVVAAQPATRYTTSGRRLFGRR